MTSTPNPVSKSDFRAFAKKLISGIATTKKQEIESIVQGQIRKLLQANMPATVISYRSDKWELDIFPLVAEFPEIEFYFPKVDKSNTTAKLNFLSPTLGWEQGSFGLWEPVETEESKSLDPKSTNMIFLPGLAFHYKGYRLGRGVGYYDQNLLEVPRSSIYAVIWDECSRLQFPYETHDIRAGQFISEIGVHGFLD